MLRLAYMRYLFTIMFLSVALLSACADVDGHMLPWSGGDSRVVTQGHGYGSHVGLGEWAWDFDVPEGTPVLASRDGIVGSVRGDSVAGGCHSFYANQANYVVVDHGDGTESLYLHLAAAGVYVGQPVTRGQVIGLGGDTGWSCGPHLHFQVQGVGAAWFGQSTKSYFHDSGIPMDPSAGDIVTSRNEPAE
jgi:murein DD-endopeptidase MepM/ murein hydrolase activator NlpD